MKKLFANPYFSVLIILLIASFLRIYKLEEYPQRVNQDELSNIYDAYSIVETGADRWGEKMPLYLQAFGLSDFRPPLCTWIDALGVKIFGFSVFAGRVTSAVMGILSLLLLYLFTKKIGGERFALLTLLLASLSPWHLLFSRMTHEGTILPTLFMISALYLWILARERNYSYIYLGLLGFIIGLGTNSYLGHRFVAFLSILVFLIDIVRSGSINYFVPRSLVLGGFALIGASPQIYLILVSPEHFFGRASTELMPFEFSLTYFGEVFINIFRNLNPYYLFFETHTYNNLSIGRLLTVELPFFYLGVIGLYFVLKKVNVLYFRILLIFIVIAILPSAITNQNPHALRTSSAIVLYAMLSAAGMLWLIEKIKSETVQKAVSVLLIVLITANATWSINKYVRSNSLPSDGHQSDLVLLYSKLNQYKDKYSPIYIEDIGNQPYIYLISFCNVTPQSFQKMEKKYTGDIFYHFSQVDKYFFINSDTLSKTIENNSSSFLAVTSQKLPNLKLVDSLRTEIATFFFYERKKLEFPIVRKSH